ncbi:MAG: hypothetical protein AB7K09_11245 [Planctomycetota bacterium]
MFAALTRCALLALVAVLVAAFSAPALADDYRVVKKEFDAAYKAAGADSHARATAVLILTRDDSKKTFGVVMSVAEHDTDSEVRVALARVLGGYRADETLDEWSKSIAREKDVNCRMVMAEGAVRSTHGRRAEFVRALLDDRKNPVVPMLIIQSIGNLDAKELIPVLVQWMQTLDSSEETLLVTAAELIQQKGERDVVMPGLLHALRSTEGRAKERIREALSKIAGGDWGNDASKWEYWWRAKQGEEKGAGSGANMSGVQAEKAPPRRPPYYGIPLNSSRIVFIIDNSGSMLQPISPNLKTRLENEDKETEEKEEAVITGMSAEDAKTRREEKKKEVPIDWGKINTKMDLAKAQLVRAISGLPQDVWFGVVFYNTAVTTVEPRMSQATDANKKRYITEVEKLQAMGMTNIICALTEAMALFKDGRSNVKLEAGNMKETIETLQTDANLLRKGADTIFFLTDGSPTWSHTVKGAGVGSHIFTNGTKAYLDEICGDFALQNQVRKVKVHTIGIGPHDRDLLGRLAQENGGIYKDLSQ